MSDILYRILVAENHYETLVMKMCDDMKLTKRNLRYLILKNIDRSSNHHVGYVSLYYEGKTTRFTINSMLSCSSYNDPWWNCMIEIWLDQI